MRIEDTSGQDVALKTKKNNKPIISLVIISIVFVLAYFTLAPALNNWSSSYQSISSQRLRLATVDRGDLVRDLSVQGRVVASVSPRLYSPAQGTITFLVDAGDSVAINQELALIDSPELTNTLKQEESSLQRARMELDRERIQAKKQALDNQKAVDLALVALTAADREKRRSDKAYKSHSISQIDFEKAQDELENAKLVHNHAVKDAELNLESLAFEIQTKQLQLDRQALLVDELSRQVDELTLRSPVNGIVGNLAVQQKNQVTQNQPILSVVDLSEFELEVDIPESYADDLAIGMQAEVFLNGETHLATLVTISPEIEDNQVNGRVRFATHSNEGAALQQPSGLRQNQRLTTRIMMEKKSNVLTVQRGQFLDSGSGRIAYLVRDGIAHKTNISSGARSLSSVEIVEGLNAGDTIVISSTEQFNGAERILITD
ncbi:HlyD family efflux transporter periplasmic adaptor subunit [Aliiglaciecola sp. LCG003]|uniref:efflux RND transporter periplasmic adaptor subunit n=1 Tax=Aliiglaciecola sp. LCG003 TaxID=3053655 RepID=UPI002573B20A|nr:HlyD family efflux transporter periplasmic adaptor subunit [Aliiglaciecola sp. LCG003]WJG10916.1 HlyD family efflux transporter periplasmic adaptor subunit [Aliiglaciecola sp. LCG003]